MKIVELLASAVPLVFAGACVATTVAQAAGIGWLWSSGKLSEEKMVRYAAIVYGLDMSEIPMGNDSQGDADDGLLTREEILESRVQQSPLLDDRQTAVHRGTDSIRILFENLRSDNDRYEQMKDRFDAHLAQLETVARAEAIEEVQRTLEVLQAKQAKDLILAMLDEQGIDPTDDVLNDVVTMVKSMPTDKRRKILGEFKTEEERERLHIILLEIGQLTEDE